MTRMAGSGMLTLTGLSIHNIAGVQRGLVSDLMHQKNLQMLQDFSIAINQKFVLASFNFPGPYHKPHIVAPILLLFLC